MIGSDEADRWVGIVANAHSGTGAGRGRVDRLTVALRRKGLDSRVVWSPAERSALVAEANRDDRCLCLVAAGGDGTVAALVNEFPEVPMTVLPVGTENLFARHFGMRGRPEDVATTILGGRVARIDLGLTGGRRFALMAGLGFDADVVTRHHLARVDSGGGMRRTHRAAYVRPVLRSTFRYRFPPMTVQIADEGAEETLIGSTVFVFNLPRYALGLPIAPLARGDDGWLDLVVFRDPGALRTLRYLWMVFRGHHLDHPEVAHRRVRRLTVSCDVDVAVQLDGDPGGRLGIGAEGPPWSVEVLPEAIDVMVPSSFAINAAPAKGFAHGRS